MSINNESCIIVDTFTNLVPIYTPTEDFGQTRQTVLPLTLLKDQMRGCFLKEWCLLPLVEL